ncbi:S41 family peptidase [Ancylomarina longa]|uniref:Tail specific protease domain-containing protein n=1 Tax=Ancylomarina longa TaxID=2487017 RepID=A0A434AYM0_9BACT|nr:S41 family peptidase [Ancylomarina longa]RUT79669.1 hypothetical protein DLK05_02995 [Ancylomarina longa]
MRKISLLIIGLSFMLSCNSQKNCKTIDWDSDLDFMSNALPQKHYNLFAVKSQKEYLEGIEKIRKNKNELSDFEMAMSLQQLVASFGDSHTHVRWGKLIDKKQFLPLHLYWFKDGMYILHTTDKYKSLLGQQLLSINHIPVDDIADSLSTLITVDNQALVKNAIPHLLPSVQVLKYFGIAESKKIELELKDDNGQIKFQWIEPAEMNSKNRIGFQPDSLALCYRNKRIFFIDYYQAREKLFYLQYNKCWGRECEMKFGRKKADKLPSFEDFGKHVFTILKNEPVDKLVFDIRLNGGGSSEQGTALIEKIAKYAKKNPDLKLYVVLGRKTFSSAIINAMDFKRLTNAVFVGEETGGKPNHFGEVRGFKLPHSGIEVLYSTKYFKETDEVMNSLQPDIQIETSFEDYKKGTDPVYDWIKKNNKIMASKQK